MVSSVAACCVWPSYGTHPTMHCQWGLTLTFKLRRDFCTMHLTIKFDHPKFNRLEVIMRTNRRHWKHPPRFATLCWWIIMWRRCVANVPVHMDGLTSNASQTWNAQVRHFCVRQGRCRTGDIQTTDQVLTKSINSVENRASLRHGGSPWTTCVSWSNTLFHFGYGNRPVAVSI